MGSADGRHLSKAWQIATDLGQALTNQQERGYTLGSAIMALCHSCTGPSWRADRPHLQHLLAVLFILHLTPSKLQSELDLVTLQPGTTLCQQEPLAAVGLHSS